MIALKEVFLVLCCVLAYSASFDLSDMDYVSDKIMGYSSGTKKTVTLYRPKIEEVKPKKDIIGRPPKRFGAERRDAKKSGSKRRKSRPSGILSSLPYVSIPMIKRIPKYEILGSSFGSSMGAGYGGVSSEAHGFYSGGPRQPKEKLTFVAQNKTYNKRTTPSNKFIEAVSSIERGTAEAKAADQWSKNSGLFSLEETKKDLELAVKNGKYHYAREKLGRALYHIKQNTWPLPRNQTTNGTGPTDQATSYMDDLRKTLGSERFDEFLAVMGDVTLMFAIDTTGSMSDDIDAAKRIAVDVINHPRENPVRYLLSPFNDPRKSMFIS